MKNRFALALTCVILLSIPWLGGTGVTLLFALVPLFVIQQLCRGGVNRKGRAPRLLWWVVGVFAVWNTVTVWWIANAALIGAVAAVIIGTTLQSVAFMTYDYVWRRAPRALAYTLLVSLWIALEHLFMFGELSFPWLMLGNGFANDPWAVQWYEYTGAYGGSLWVLLCNILIFEMLLAPRRIGRVVAANVAVVVPLAVSLGIYFSYDEPKEKAVVTVIQPNLDPYTEKFSIGQDEQNAVMLSLAMQAPRDVNFIIAPETAIDDQLWEENLCYSQSVQEFQGMIRGLYPHATYITGATTMRSYPSASEASETARLAKNVDLWYDVYNSALYIDSTGSVPVHHKSILVAGVEKMPFYGVMKNFDFLTVELGGITGQLGVDKEQKVFETGEGLTSATAICYESIYGEYFSKFVRRGAQIMFVITNDGWWGDTPGYRQHFSYSRLRAIETRRSIARSANTGISALITPRGDVVDQLGWDIRGTVTGSLPLNSRLTVYTLAGDYIARLSWFVAVLSLLYFVAYRTKKKDLLR